MNLQVLARSLFTYGWNLFLNPHALERRGRSSTQDVSTQTDWTMGTATAYEEYNEQLKGRVSQLALEILEISKEIAKIEQSKEKGQSLDLSPLKARLTAMEKESLEIAPPMLQEKAKAVQKCAQKLIWEVEGIKETPFAALGEKIKKLEDYYYSSKDDGSGEFSKITRYIPNYQTTEVECIKIWMPKIIKMSEVQSKLREGFSAINIELASIMTIKIEHRDLAFRASSMLDCIPKLIARTEKAIENLEQEMKDFGVRYPVFEQVRQAAAAYEGRNIEDAITHAIEVVSSLPETVRTNSLRERIEKLKPHGCLFRDHGRSEFIKIKCLVPSSLISEAECIKVWKPEVTKISECQKNLREEFTISKIEIAGIIEDAEGTYLKPKVLEVQQSILEEIENTEKAIEQLENEMNEFESRYPAFKRARDPAFIEDMTLALVSMPSQEEVIEAVEVNSLVTLPKGSALSKALESLNGANLSINELYDLLIEKVMGGVKLDVVSICSNLFDHQGESHAMRLIITLEEYKKFAICEERILSRKFDHAFKIAPLMSNGHIKDAANRLMAIQEYDQAVSMLCKISSPNLFDQNHLLGACDNLLAIDKDDLAIQLAQQMLTDESKLTFCEHLRKAGRSFKKIVQVAIHIENLEYKDSVIRWLEKINTEESKAALDDLQLG